MNTVAKLILDKLSAIETRMTALEGKIDAQDVSFLNEVVEQPSPRDLALPKLRGRKKQTRHLPPKLTKALLSETQLAESTRNTYENTLYRLLENPELVPVLIRERNKGKLYSDIAARSQQLLGKKFTDKRLQNMVSVGLRYEVLVRTPDGKYAAGDALKASA
jgi:hypothetical protein